MKDRYFLDSNIITYTFDNKAEKKQTTSTQLVRNGLTSGNAIISYQVIQEFCNVATKKFKPPITQLELDQYVDIILTPLCQSWPSIRLYQKAIMLQKSTKYGFYDSLIIASALQEKCTLLYSEDLQHNQTIESLTILNPFK